MLIVVVVEQILFFIFFAPLCSGFGLLLWMRAEQANNCPFVQCEPRQLTGRGECELGVT